MDISQPQHVPDNTRLQAALDLAKQGVRVFPTHGVIDGRCTCGDSHCSNVGKHPLTGNGFYSATTESFIIHRWYETAPDANVAMRTGQIVVVLDADDGAEGEREAAAYGVTVAGPHTVTGNGKHFYFHAPAGVVLRCKRKNAGDWPFAHCDARGEGGYVIAAPSRHASGREYVLSQPFDVTTLPDVPPALLAVWQDAPDDPRNRQPLADDVPDGAGANPLNDALRDVTATYYTRKYIEQALGLRRADRNDTGVLLALQLRDNGISAHDAEAYMREYQRAVAKARPNKATYTWKEAKSTLASIYRTPKRRAAQVNVVAPGKLVWATQHYLTLYGERLRYIQAYGRAYVSNGRWWEPDEQQIAKRFGAEAVLAIYQQAALERDPTKRADLLRIASTLDTADKVNAMVASACAFPPIAARAEDADANDWQAVCANGMLDLRTGALLPHDPAAFHTRHLGPKRTSMVYDPAATCPNWLEFLKVVLDGDDDLIGFVQRAAGYTLTGDISEQCWFLLTGDGENGKSTLTKAIRDVLGAYSHTLPVTTLLATKFDQIPTDIADLVGLRGAFASESEDGKQLAASLIKQMTGGEDLTARHLRQDFFTFAPKFKLWFHTNHKPLIRDTSRGTWRRIRPIPFTVTIQQADKYFYERKLAPELPGILTWMMAGCLDWQRHGLGLPKVMEQARDSYRNESDVTDDFLTDYVWAEARAVTTSADLYECYQRFCRLRGEMPITQNKLSRAVRERFGLTAESIDGRVRSFKGLEINRRGLGYDW